MPLRNSKGKRLKRTDKVKSGRETRLLLKLQKESLKAHVDPLDAPKKRK
jgi:hypothetical protein